MRKLILLSLIVFVTASTSIAQQAANPGVVLTKEQVDAIVQPLVDDANAQSIVVGIIDPGGTHVYGYGKLSKEIDRAPDGKTVFEIGALTAPLTGTIMAVMKQDGVMNYEDPVQNYLPADVKLEVKDRPMTLLDLATQHSGLPLMFDNNKPKDPNDPYADYDESKLYELLKTWKPTRAPGAEYEYSNVGLSLLGHVLAKHANLSYEQMVHDRVTEPLQMTDTTLTENESQKSRVAPGHNDDGKLNPSWHMNDAIAGGGGLRSTCDDILKFAEAQIHPPQGKLGDAIRETREAREQVTPGREVGLTWMIDAGGICIWHNGQTGGYHSFIAIGPDAGVAVVILSNSSGASLDQAGSEIIRAQLGLPGMPPVPPREAVELTKEQMDRFVGEYQLGPGTILKIWRKDDKLMTQLTNQPAFRIFPESEKQLFLKVVDAQLEFDFPDDKGPAKSLTLHQNGRHMPAPRIEQTLEPATKPGK
jgi:D-alanyl-D-alanine-carboxypeptidase/D-alanyl-D-alanine-endopeptidase